MINKNMNRKLNLVVDTNIFINALSDEYNTSCIKILNLIENNKVNIIFAQDTFGELIYMLKHWSRKNIANKKDRLVLLHNFVDLFYNSLSVNTKRINCPKINDKFDEMFIKCAIKGNVDYLISDDLRSGMHGLNDFGFKVITSDGFVKLVG